MSFGAANDMMKRIVSVRPVDVLIIDLSEVPGIDGSTALTLEQIISVRRKLARRCSSSACTWALRAC